MKEFNLKTGQIGEMIAKEFLEKKGYQIVAQNFRTKYLEIDLICQDGKELIFVEVRTKRGLGFGSPEESLTKRKLRKLWFNAKSYIKINNWEKPYRIDVICILLKKDNTVEQINHYQNIGYE